MKTGKSAAIQKFLDDEQIRLSTSVIITSASNGPFTDKSYLEDVRIFNTLLEVQRDIDETDWANIEIYLIRGVTYVAEQGMFDKYCELALDTYKAPRKRIDELHTKLAIYYPFQWKIESTATDAGLLQHVVSKATNQFKKQIELLTSSRKRAFGPYFETHLETFLQNHNTKLQSEIPKTGPKAVQTYIEALNSFGTNRASFMCTVCQLLTVQNIRKTSVKTYSVSSAHFTGNTMPTGDFHRRITVLPTLDPFAR